MENIVGTLQKRGFVDAITSEELEERVEKPIALYCGFDPTSDSLHLGNLVSLMGLAWFQRTGHKAIALIGGATGMIGDPSGKSEERALLDAETLERNVAALKKQIRGLLGPEVVVLDNLDWYREMGVIDFLRDVGKRFRIGPMLGKESVRARLESEEGMSFTEFSYQILQANDFLYLFRKYGVELQIGGSDQWGNITAGTELVRKVTQQGVYGLTFPLLTDAEGKKFGKTERGAIWLSPDRLSSYDFYQSLYRVQDADVGKLLRMLTFLDLEEIEALEGDPSPNTAQARLAEEVTRFVHGQQGVEQALRVTSQMRPGSTSKLDVEALLALAKELAPLELARNEVVGKPLVDLFLRSGLQKSKGAVRKLIQNRGAYLNNRVVEESAHEVEEGDLLGGEWLLLAAGKKNKVLLRVK